jgi:hypothetical protein
MAFTASTWGQGRLLTGLSPGSSLSGFTAVITKANLPTSALDTGSLSCLNGGGDWRFSTDINGSTQLPAQIVTCVTNATAGNTRFEARIRFPTYASGTREVYAFWNKAGQSQPLVGAAFGRNAVWVGYLFATTDGGLTDSSGNLTTTATGGTPLLQSGEHGGDARRVGTSGYYISSAVSGYTTSNPITTHSRFLASNTTAKILSSFSDASTTDQQLDMFSTDDSGTQRGLARSFSTSLSDTLSLNAVTLGSWQSVTARYDSNVSSIFANGAGKATGVFNNPTGLDRIGIGATSDSTAFIGADYTQGFGYVFSGAKTDDYIAAQETNESNPSTFWTAGAVFVPGGTTITVTGTTANYTYAAISGTVELTGTISVTGATPNYTYASIAGTIELTPQITVTGATPNYTYTAIAGTVESVGIISVTGTTPNYAYTAISGDITLLGTITVTGDTPNYSYSAIRGTIQLGDGVYTNSFIGFTPSQGTFNGIVKSSSFNGIINETSDFSGIVKSTTFLGVKE